MPQELRHYQEVARKMVKDDSERNTVNRKYDDMDHVVWSAPDKLRKQGWFRNMPSTDPHDAIAAGVRVLSALRESVTLQPLASNPETKNKANENEKVLEWVMQQVNKRRQGTVQRSVVRSSLKYDEVCAQVIDLDYQIKNKEVFGGDTKREKAARRYGRFVVNTYHPNNVHVLHSNYMPEAVLLVQVRKAKDVMREWGKLAGKLKRAADNDEKVTYWDYMDYDDHVIWCGTASDVGDEKKVIELMRDEHNLPFLPWVARVGGDIMESRPEHRRRPLLYSINSSGSWETHNIVRSIMMSETISYAAAPRFKEEGPMNIESRSTETDYGDMNKIIDVTPGDELTQIPPPGLDPKLMEMASMVQSEMAKSTVANVLQGADIPPGTAFATLNLATQTALGSLKPAKELAEFALADIYSLFLLWANYTENDIKGYGTGKQDVGEEYTIKWDEINTESIYLSVELKPDVPLDRMQKANVAMMMVQAGIYSKERAMEDMGVTDPDAVTKEMFFERLTEAQLQNIIDTMALQNQMAIQQQQQEQQLALQTIQNQMAGAPGGNGFNPAFGGGPAQEAAPMATREGVTGEDLMGNEAPFAFGGGFV